MRIVIQRVKSADVKVSSNVVSSIERGFLILVGISKNDTEREVRELAKKVPFLRIFEDEKGKMNLSIKDIGGKSFQFHSLPYMQIPLEEEDLDLKWQHQKKLQLIYGISLTSF